MVTQKLYIGEYYQDENKRHTCLFGKKLMVVGHQKHATPEERSKYNSIDDFNYPLEDVKSIEALTDGTWESWDPSDRKSYLQFGRMLTGDTRLSMDGMVDLWKSIAFCNYLQVPDINLADRQGRDEDYLYEMAKPIFLDKLLEAQPEKVIVWGVDTPSFKYIKNALGVSTLEHEFQVTFNNRKIDFLNIPHPCRLPQGGYDVVIAKIKEFLEK